MCDEQFATLLAQSSKLIKQATMFLQCATATDDEDQGNRDIRDKCLEAIASSNEAMLGVSEKLLEKKQKILSSEREKTETIKMNFSRSNRLVTFDNIIGSHEAKLALYENLILPLSMSAVDRKKIFQGVLSGGGNVLLFGPPGTGKTLLAQAAACEANAELFSIRPSEILSKYQGESEKYISNLFTEAKKCPRAVIFFDEFDSIATARGGKMEDCSMHRRLLAELLLQLSLHSQKYSATATGASSTPINANANSSAGTENDEIAPLSSELVTERSKKPTPLNSHSSVTTDVDGGVHTSSDTDVYAAINDNKQIHKQQHCPSSASSAPAVPHLCSPPGKGEEDDHALVVVAATNRLEDLDEVYVGVPDKNSRIEMISYFLRGIKHGLEAGGLSRVASYSIGWSGSEVQTLCREAAMGPLREVMSSVMSSAGNSSSKSNSPSSYSHDMECSTRPTSNTIRTNNVPSQKRKRPTSISAEHIRPVTIEDFDLAYHALVREPEDPTTEEINQAYERSQQQQQAATTLFSGT